MHLFETLIEGGICPPWGSQESYLRTYSIFIGRLTYIRQIELQFQITSEMERLWGKIIYLLCMIVSYITGGNPIHNQSH